MQLRQIARLCALLVTLAVSRSTSHAVTTTATNNGNWANSAIWNNGAPGNGDIALLPSGRSVILTNSTAFLDSLIVTNNATLTFNGGGGAGTNIVLNATNVSVYGTITHDIITTSATNLLGQWVPSNGVYIACSNLTVAASGSINVNQKGYRGGVSYGWGKGPGGTAPRVNSVTGGAGHGGVGGNGGSAGGSTYGSYQKPLNPGSGSGADHGGGFEGGGMVRIEATGNIRVNGSIKADGRDGNNRGGGGSGGSVYLECHTIDGSGLVTAHGGNGDVTYGSGGGGGGRISVAYDTTAQSNVVTKPTIVFGAKQGQGLGGSVMVANSGRPGTICFPDTSVLWSTMRGGVLLIPGFSSWRPDTLSISDGILALAAGFDLGTTNSLIVSGTGGGIELTDSPELLVGGDLILTNKGCLYLYSGITNGSAPDYGMLVSVTGDLVIAANSTLYPYSNPTNGGSVMLAVSNLLLNTGGAINATAKGWAGGTSGQHGYGPGGGQSGVSGGGYGGQGGGAAGGYGGTYGSAAEPIYPGSGGGGIGGRGGGLVRMEIADTATLSGTIAANGGGSTYGGSGGGIYLHAATFALAYGSLQATGGAGSSKGGGGGRISLSYSKGDSFDGSINVVGGTGSSTGNVGTVNRASDGTGVSLTVKGSPLRHGVSSPYDYGTYVLAEGTVITNIIPDAAEQTSTSRYYCTGWTLTNDVGALVDSSVSTQAVFTMSTNLALTWKWTNQFYLITTANTNGTLQDDRTAWYHLGTPVDITAVPDGTYVLLRWSGTGLPTESALDNPISVSMTRARTIQANFCNSTVESLTWNGSANWLVPGNWSPPGIPGPNDAVTIRSGSCVLTDPMTVGSLSMSNGATLTFNGTGYYGTNLSLAAGNVHVNGAITHYANSATAMVGGEWVPDNAVRIRATHFTLGPNGTINCNEKGFRGGPVTTDGYGPGRTLRSVNGSTGGAGYGGRGGNGWTTAGGSTYGNADAPLMPGSGSGGDWGVGRHGGGLVHIECAMKLQIDGTISVKGQNSSNRAGGGSGGGVYLVCNKIMGNGTINADGGASDPTYGGGGGGGGRVAIWSTVRAESLTVSATNGPKLGTSNIGDPGTIVWGHILARGTVLTVR